jgi:hypothetical protein
VADCGRFTGALYSQARGIIAAELGADRERYAVIFTGSGATAALHKLASAPLKMVPTTHPGAAARAGPGAELMLPMVFVGLEHHSNDVLWREQPCTVVVRAVQHYTSCCTTGSLHACRVGVWSTDYCLPCGGVAGACSSHDSPNVSYHEFSLGCGLVLVFPALAAWQACCCTPAAAQHS